MYSAEVDGAATEFGTSGMLYRSNKLMYDRATETLWHQFRGEPVVGPLAGSGIRLEILPNVLTTWGDWAAEHPDTTVISDDTGVYAAGDYRAESDRRSIYYSYRADSGTMFPVFVTDDALPLKAQVFGLAFGGAARAYPRDALASAPAVNDTVGGQGVVIIADDNGAARAYDRGGLEFRAASGGLRDDRGRHWRVTEDALVNVADPARRLGRLASRDAYWFGWFAFYPHTDVYSP